MDNIVELYCLADDFCQAYLPAWHQHLLATGLKKRHRPSHLSSSEIMTIIIGFHQLRFRDFKAYYLYYVQTYLSPYFPKLVSYNRFVELLKTVLVPLCSFMQ